MSVCRHYDTIQRYTYVGSGEWECDLCGEYFDDNEEKIVAVAYYQERAENAEAELKLLREWMGQVKTESLHGYFYNESNKEYRYFNTLIDAYEAYKKEQAECQK